MIVGKGFGAPAFRQPNPKRIGWASSEITKGRLSSHLVTKLNRAALVGFDLRQMEGDVSVDLLEELDPITNQDRQDRIANFVG